MKRLLIITSVFICFFSQASSAQNKANSVLAKSILNDHRLDTIQARALKLLTGFTAGSSYPEIWIRDLNTFIRGSLKVTSGEKAKNALLMFFKIQGKDGNIVDGMIDSAKAYPGSPYIYSPLLSGWAAHKNTVETDQESSLIQAVKKYIDETGDASILAESIHGKTVLQRMEDALNYLLNERWSAKYGLIIGATTVDWGDVQPETGWGVRINGKTKWAIDVYDNAMFAIAINNFLAMDKRDHQSGTDWSKTASDIKKNVRKYLWLPRTQKYMPHLYLDGSPFSQSFNENEIIYSGGSICAILAGFNTNKEIKEINRQLVSAASKEKYATIGVTAYPPYPKAEFPNMPPYVYQNGGDWTWFGGRMTQALVAHGFVKEAYNELSPMIDRAISHNGFYEWYDIQTGEGKGSKNFRGEAGVLFDAITCLKQWAVKNQ